MSGNIFSFPENLSLLNKNEEELCRKSTTTISANQDLLLHLNAVELAMDMFDVLRQFPSKDEDFKVIQILGMRLFNAFASSFKLMISGYYQNSTLIMRDILETVFLLDKFRIDPESLSRWRSADKRGQQ